MIAAKKKIPLLAKVQTLLTDISKIAILIITNIIGRENGHSLVL